MVWHTTAFEVHPHPDTILMIGGFGVNGVEENMWLDFVVQPELSPLFPLYFNQLELAASSNIPLRRRHNPSAQELQNKAKASAAEDNSSYPPCSPDTPSKCLFCSASSAYPPTPTS